MPWGGGHEGEGTTDRTSAPGPRGADVSEGEEGESERGVLRLLMWSTVLSTEFTLRSHTIKSHTPTMILHMLNMAHGLQLRKQMCPASAQAQLQSVERTPPGSSPHSGWKKLQLCPGLTRRKPLERDTDGRWGTLGWTKVSAESERDGPFQTCGEEPRNDVDILEKVKIRKPDGGFPMVEVRSPLGLQTHDLYRFVRRL